MAKSKVAWARGFGFLALEVAAMSFPLHLFFSLGVAEETLRKESCWWIVYNKVTGVEQVSGVRKQTYTHERGCRQGG